MTRDELRYKANCAVESIPDSEFEDYPDIGQVNHLIYKLVPVALKEAEEDGRPDVQTRPLKAFAKAFEDGV